MLIGINLAAETDAIDPERCEKEAEAENWGTAFVETQTSRNSMYSREAIDIGFHSLDGIKPSKMLQTS